MRNLFLFSILFVVFALCGAGCEEDIDDADIPQFNHPQNVVLTCFDYEAGPLPIESCRDSGRTDEEIFAFVTQTEFGEVAVVNLEEGDILDQEPSIPFNSFVGVGGQPQDITASTDGRYVYTANFGTRDISVVDVSAAIWGTVKKSNETESGVKRTRQMLAAESIYVTHAPSQIVIAADVGEAPVKENSTQDRFAFITQPTVGRVAVVNLVEYVADDGNGGERVVPRGVIGWLRLDAATLSGRVTEDNRPEGIAPISMVASDQISSLFVAGFQGVGKGEGSYIAEIQRDIFIERATRTYEETGEAQALEPREIIIRRMNLDKYTVRDMSIEPELERWMYIVEKEDGGVIVLDLQSGQLINVNTWDVTRDESYSIDVPGIAWRVKMVRFSETLKEGDLPDPFTFNGTFAVVSTTQASFYVIDVAVDDEFANLVEQYTAYPHTLRSGTPWYNDDDDEQEMIYPELIGEPQLFGDDEELSHDNPFVSMLDTDSETSSETSSDTADTEHLLDSETHSEEFETDTDTIADTGTIADTDTIADTETSSGMATDSGTEVGADADNATGDAGDDVDVTGDIENANNTDTDPCIVLDDPYAFRMWEKDDDYNVYFRCDRRHTARDTWRLTYQDSVGISGKGIWDKSQSTGNSIVLHDKNKDFCNSGLLGPDSLNADGVGTLWGAYPEEGTAEHYERFRGYPGDILEVTSLPTPFPGNPDSPIYPDCSIYENDDLRKWYLITEVIDAKTIRIEALTDANHHVEGLDEEQYPNGWDKWAPLPTARCFSEVVNYRILANSSWVLRGEMSGLPVQGSMRDGHCVPWEEDEEKSHHWKSGRVFEGHDFENGYLKFHFDEISDVGRDKVKESYEQLYFGFSSINAYTPMFYNIGASITDIEIAPNNDIILIEQSEAGMIIFDMLNEFESTEDPIN